MSLRYALLAVLTAGPLTGYDAAKRFGGSVGHVWHAPDSQIYPELKRMAAEGLIAGEQVRLGPKSTKTQYSITDEGLAAFREWMNTPIDHSPERDAHHMQAAYFEWADPEGARANLLAHIDHHRRQVELLTAVRDGIEARTDPAIVQRLERYPAEDHDAIVAYKVFTYEGMIERSLAEIDWAQRGLKLVDSLQRP